MSERTEAGQRFEARVANLLRSSPGCRNVREQQHLLGKNVDIIFQKQWNPHKNITIAVECKNWKSGLDRANVQTIFLDHKPLLDAKQIDELWIVTPHPVGPTVQEYVDSFDGLEILHINEFEQDIIDFSLYVEFLARKFSQERLSQYYIPSRLDSSTQTLHDKVCDWLTSTSSAPIAVWAGYGMGKTSYATYLASTLAEQFISDTTKRIPILIPLGDFYTAPRIDGLFANVLTNEYGVHGYNFNTFWNLHQAGRFVIVLDGFDEMKHAMTALEFAAISKEIRKLILPNSKVILLGRPDAIISEEEHTILIEGTRRISGFEIADTIGVKFIECRLDFFSQDEYLNFLERYLSAFCELPDKSEFVQKRLSEVQKIELSDILKRPVQARMLAQILLNPRNSIEKISKFDLYTMFIEECLSRESEKHERKKLDSTSRRRFIQDLSWWLWAIKRTRTFTVSDIPQSLSKSFIEPGQDPIGQIRELLVGSVVEERSIGSLVSEKNAGTFYFPHLSFTEFLVAEFLIERTLKDAELRILARSLDGEIISFLQSCKKIDALFKIYSDLTDFKSSLPWHFIDFLSESPTLKRQIKKLPDKEVRSVWQFAVEFVVLMKHGESDKAIPKCINVIASDQFRYTSVAVQLLLKQLILLDVQTLTFANAATSLMGSLFRGINIDKLADTARVKHVPYRIVSETEGFFVSLLTEVSVAIESGAFQFSASDLYMATIRETETSAAITETDMEIRSERISVKFSEVRRWLRTKHDRERFDFWIGERSKSKSTGYVFDELR